MRKKITTQKKEAYREHTKELLEQSFSNSLESSYTIAEAYNLFSIWQDTKNNSKATIDFYNRFYIKLKEFLQEYFKTSVDECPIKLMSKEVFQPLFINFLQKSIKKNTGKEASIQTINAYLRG
ncbi:MAG: hypothetical protein IJY02_03050, partial [Oscillospiraceae bacterium]|nr:hypothetical protein [Oscillospiraceae bacterium]